MMVLDPKQATQTTALSYHQFICKLPVPCFAASTTAAATILAAPDFNLFTYCEQSMRVVEKVGRY